MKKLSFILIGIFIIAIAVFSYQHVQAPADEELKNPIMTATIRNIIFEIELAQTTSEKEKGLSGRISMDQNKGMLFLFDAKNDYPFWMKDMNFALDMIWIDEDKIVNITHSILPPKNKDEYPAIASPTKLINKVLEINAGLSKQYGFEVGDSVDIKIKSEK